LNTLAFCAGVLSFGWIAPRASLFFSLKLFPAVFAIGAALLFLLRDGQRIASWKPGLAAAALLGAAALTPSGFDASFFEPDSLAALHPVEELKSNGANTTFVVDDPAGKRLFFGSHSMSGADARGLRYMRLMAHFPLLAHPAPRDALLICFGIGTTASAIAVHDGIERLDAVELNHRVFETAPAFAATNGRVYADPRVRLIHADGRTFLDQTDRRYDLITSEPPPPMQDGVARLYSVEFYEAALARLTPEGLMTQWLPTWQMPREAVDRAMATFVHVFPHTLAFVGSGDDFILVGSPAPIDLARIERRFFESDAVAADLQAVGVDHPVKLLARIARSDSELRGAAAGVRLIRDQRNDLALLFRNPTAGEMVEYDPAAVLQSLPDTGLRSAPALRRVLGHPARLLGAVPDFPIATLASAPRSDAAPVLLGDVRWQDVNPLNLEAARAEREARYERSLGLYRRSLELEPDQVGVVQRVGQLEFALGRWEDALASWQRYGRLGLGDGLAEWGAGLALLELDRPAEALPYLEEAVERIPVHAERRASLADALARSGRKAEALAQYDRALALDPDLAEAREGRASLVAAGS